MPNDISPRVFPYQSLEMRPISFCTALIPLHSPNQQSIALCSTSDLRRFDLWACATYTDTQKVAMLLGSIPPGLDRQHKKAWVPLTFSTCTQLSYSIQSHPRLTQPPVLLSTSLPTTILSSPPLDDTHCQVCQSSFDEHKLLLCDICNAGLAYGLPSPPPYHHPNWDLEMRPMPPALPPTLDNNTTHWPSFPHSRL